MTPLARLLCLALAWLLASAPVRADRGEGDDDHGRRGSAPIHGWTDEDHSYDRARRATERGEILPLETIYARALARIPGRVLEAELERKGRLWVYELKILDDRGRLFEVYLDASTGAILKHEVDD
ncbi:MAG: PepSY domain-containing protein [Chromatiaceae bacterium]